MTPVLTWTCADTPVPIASPVLSPGSRVHACSHTPVLVPVADTYVYIPHVYWYFSFCAFAYTYTYCVHLYLYLFIFILYTYVCIDMPMPLFAHLYLYTSTWSATPLLDLCCTPM